MLTKESYDHAGMQAARRAAIEAAAGARTWGLVLGTLGRQGNPRILAQLRQLLERQGRQFVTVLLSGGWVGGRSEGGGAKLGAWGFEGASVQGMQ